MREKLSFLRRILHVKSTASSFCWSKISIFIFFLLQCSYLTSQVVNIEQARVRLDSTGWAGIAHASFQSQKYESLLFSASLRGAIQHRVDRRIWMYLVDAGISAADNVQFNNNALGHVRYNYVLMENKLQWETFTQMQQNRLLGLDRRNLLGSGFRWIIADNEKANVNFGLLAMLEVERAKPAPESYWFGRTSSYVSFVWKEPGKFALSSTTYYQPLMGKSADFRLMGQHAIAFALHNLWSFRVELTHFYDSRPPMDIVKGTFNTSLGVAYDFGKMKK